MFLEDFQDSQIIKLASDHGEIMVLATTHWVTKRNGAIGGAGKIPNKKKLDLKFAVYPDYEMDRKAQA
jgi:hypothetical protein